MVIWAAGNIQMPVGSVGWDCSMAFPPTQRRQLPRDWRNESGRWRNWFGKQLVTGDLPTPVPERDSGRLGAGWRCSPGRGMKGIAPFPKPAARRPWAHTTGLAPKIPQVPPSSTSGSSRVPQTRVAVASLQHRWAREQEYVKGIAVLNSSDLREIFSC